MRLNVCELLSWGCESGLLGEGGGCDCCVLPVLAVHLPAGRITCSLPASSFQLSLGCCTVFAAYSSVSWLLDTGCSQGLGVRVVYTFAKRFA